MFVRPCFSEDEPDLLTCSHPTEACDKETNDFRLVRLDASKVGYLKKRSRSDRMSYDKMCACGK